MFNKIYHIVFNVNGGNNLDDILCKSGKAFPVLPYATKEGYKFLGWFLDENFENEVTLEKMPKKNLVLYAKWEVISLEEFSKDINFFTKSSNILQNLQNDYSDVPNFKDVVKKEPKKKTSAKKTTKKKTVKKESPKIVETVGKNDDSIKTNNEEQE